MTNHFITTCCKWRKKMKALTILFARYFTSLLQNEPIINLSHSSVELYQGKTKTKAQLKHTQWSPTGWWGRVHVNE